MTLTDHLCRGIFQLRPQCLPGPAPARERLEGCLWSKREGELLGHSEAEAKDGATAHSKSRRAASPPAHWLSCPRRDPATGRALLKPGGVRGESADLFPEKKSAFATPEMLWCADSSAAKPPLSLLLCCALRSALQELFAISNTGAGWQWQGGGEQGGGSRRWLSLVSAVVCPCLPGRGIISAVSEETRGHKLVLV